VLGRRDASQRHVDEFQDQGLHRQLRIAGLSCRRVEGLPERRTPGA